MEKTVTVETMTPEWAAKLLEKNDSNRSVSRNVVKTYIRDLLEGRFAFNGDAIRLREDGVLADGQHRLLACVETGISFQTVFVTGLTFADVLTLDSGRKRTASDALTIAGDHNANRVAAALRALAIFARQDCALKLTTPETFALNELHPRMQDSVGRTSVLDRRHGTVRIHSGQFTALHYTAVVFQDRSERVEKFLSVLSGDTMPEGSDDPAFRLQQAFLRDKAARSRMTTVTRLLLISNAWAHYSKHRPLKLLKAGDDFSLEGLNEKTLMRFAG